MNREEENLTHSRVELLEVAAPVDDGAKAVGIRMSSDRVDDMETTETDLSVGESGFYRIDLP